MLPNFVGTVFEASCIQQSWPMVPIELPKGRIDSGLGLNPAIVMLEEGGFRFVFAGDEKEVGLRRGRGDPSLDAPAVR
jgi:hypothetical protein